MNLDDNVLRSLYAEYLALRIPINRNKCPSLNEIDMFFISSVSWRRKKKLVDHFSNCAYCTRDFNILREVHGFETSVNIDISPITNDTKIFNNTVLTTSIRPLFWRLSWVLIGFALIGFSINSIALKQAQIKGQRASNRMLSIFYPSSQHSFSKPLIFRWQRHIGAQFYIVELFNEYLLPVWKSEEIYNSHYILPEAILASLNGDKTYYWMVTSYTNMEKVNESELIGFKLYGKKR
jgi:hypothetical protein